MTAPARKYRFADLPVDAQANALEEYWQVCLDGPETERFKAQFADIAEENLADVIDYFFNLNGTRIEYDYWDLAQSISFFGFHRSGNFVTADVDPKACFIDPEWDFDAARHGVPLDDISWDFVLPDPEAIGFDEPESVRHYALCVNNAARAFDYYPSTVRTLDDLLDEIKSVFLCIVLTAGYIMVADHLTYILNDLADLLSLDLNKMGPVFNADGSVADGSVPDGSFVCSSR